MSFPTEIEQFALNPHRLNSGDRVILPDGTPDVIDRAGFKWARFADRQPYLLKDLRPFSQTEAGNPNTQQLSLL
jgi:hypothetical protein